MHLKVIAAVAMASTWRALMFVAQVPTEGPCAGITESAPTVVAHTGYPMEVRQVTDESSQP